MAIFILVGGLVLLWFFIVKPMRIKHDTCVLYVGGLGSGKTRISVSKAKSLTRRQRRKVRFHNFFHPKDKWQKPLLYSNIPIRLSAREYSVVIDDLTPVLATRVVPRSVVFFDEVSLWLDQMTVKPKNAQQIEEFCTLFRHYTQGGFLVLNTQNTAKVNFHIRYCLNRAYHLAEFRKFLCFYWVKCRDLSLIDDEKSVNIGSLTDSYKTLFGIFPFRKDYDSYCYSDRVSDTPLQSEKKFTCLKTNHIARAPSVDVEPILREE